MTKLFSRRAFLGLAGFSAGVASLGLAGCLQNEDSRKNEIDDATSEKDRIILAGISLATEDFSPVGSLSELAVAANRHVFEGLYELNLADGRINPAVADGEPVKISDVEYEVKIKSDKKFSDGALITVEDVIGAFEQNISDEMYSKFLSFIQTVEKKDDLTVLFKLKQQFDTFLKSRLSLVKIFPKSIGAGALKSNPIGSGPWAFESIDGSDGGLIRFVKNINYSGNFVPENEKMEWRVLADEESRVNALTSGEVMAIDGVSQQFVERITSAQKTVEYVPSSKFPFLLFNTKKSPFDNAGVRQAFFYALDVDKMIADKMGGHAKSASCLLPETHPNYHQSKTVFSFDAKKSRDLLKSAGVSNLKCEILVDSIWVSRLANQIKDNLTAVGIEASIKEASIDWSSVDSSEEVPSFDVILSAGDPSYLLVDADFLISWWFADSPWMSKRARWADSSDWKKLQKNLEAARAEIDQNKQQEIYNACFDIISSNCPLYPLFHVDVATAYDSFGVSDFSPIATGGLDFIGAKAK